MGMSNKELIEKATITTDAIASAGKLSPRQADMFIDFVTQETSMQDKIRNVRFTREQTLIDKINVGNRVAVPKVEATDPGVRRGVTTSAVTLQPVEIMCPFEIGDLFKDENIEGDNVEEHVIKMFARRFANNIEELWWDGNTVGPAQIESDLLEGGSTSLYVNDSYLALFNGWLKLAESGHVVDAQGAAMSPALMARAIRALPNKFRRNKRLLKFLCSPDHEQTYRESVSTRATKKGDDELTGQSEANVLAYGVEVMPVSLLDGEPVYVENSVANTDGATATSLTHAPITDLRLLPTTLAAAATAKYILGTDYSQDLTTGTWTRLGGGSIGSGATVKATYLSAGRFLLTMLMNMIAAIGRDITLERDRNIYKGVNEFALTAKVHGQFEETDAVVLVKNVAVPT